MRIVRHCVTLGAVIWLTACATTAGTSAARGGDRSFLTAEELRAESPGRSLHDVLRQRRPQWLAKRGPVSLRGSSDIVVYSDGVAVGGPAVLQTISTQTVESVRFLSAAEATTRFGTGHAHGAILVQTRRR